MTKDGISALTAADRPDLLESTQGADAAGFPEFILHDPVWDRGWARMIDDLAHLQVFLVDEDDEVVALGNAITFRWDGTDDDLPRGTHDAIERCVRELQEGVDANTICFTQALVLGEHKGRGVSRQLMEALIATGTRHGLTSAVSPIRPALKASYPTIPMERYVSWRRADGERFDPWIRVQDRLGAEIVRIDSDSLVIESPVADWETWTGIVFPESGDYVIPGGLTTLHISREDDVGRYSEEHVWMRYP